MNKIGIGGKADMGQSATLIAHNRVSITAQLHQHYKVVAFRRGRHLWTSEFDNLVVTAGFNKYLDATLKSGLTTPAWYVFLKNTGTVVAGDTMASHAGWTENTTYSQANRPTWTPGTIAAGSVDNSGSVAVFSINGTTTIYGAGMTDVNTKGGATGTLLGAGDFASNRPVISGDTLNVTITCSLT